MKQRSYTTEGVVLTKRDYGEADRIFIIFSKDYGRITLIAKGVRRPESRKRGHLEIFNKIRFQGVATRGINILTEAEITDNYREIRTSLKKISLAYYFMEVVGRITHDGEKNLDLYNLIVDGLDLLKKTKSLKKLRLDFIGKLLILMGFWPAGKTLAFPDEVLEDVLERHIYSTRVGKIILG